MKDRHWIINIWFRHFAAKLTNYISTVSYYAAQIQQTWPVNARCSVFLSLLYLSLFSFFHRVFSSSSSFSVFFLIRQKAASNSCCCCRGRPFPSSQFVCQFPRERSLVEFATVEQLLLVVSVCLSGGKKITQKRLFWSEYIEKGKEKLQ